MTPNPSWNKEVFQNSDIIITIVTTLQVVIIINIITITIIIIIALTCNKLHASGTVLSAFCVLMHLPSQQPYEKVTVIPTSEIRIFKQKSLNI